MATCTTCGKPLTVFHKCSEAAIASANQHVADRLGDSESHCQATVTDVVAKSQDGSAQIGDFFVARGGLVLVFYTRFPSFPRWSEGAATLAGGVGAGLGIALVRMQEGNSARSRAVEMRAQDTGSSLRDRIRRHGGLVLLKGEIRSIESSPRSQMIRITHSDGTLVVAVTNADGTKHVISRWLAGALQDEEDTLLVNAGLPQVDEMLAWIEEPSKFPGIASDDCTRAAHVASYCKQPVGRLKKRPWLQRQRLCRLAKERSASLASSIGSAMAASPGGQGAWIAAFLCGLQALILLGAGVPMRMASVDSSDYLISGWVMLGGAGLGFLALLLLGFALRDRQRNKELAARFLGKP